MRFFTGTFRSRNWTSRKFWGLNLPLRVPLGDRAQFMPQYGFWIEVNFLLRDLEICTDLFIRSFLRDKFGNKKWT